MYQRMLLSIQILTISFELLLKSSSPLEFELIFISYVIVKLYK